MNDLSYGHTLYELRVKHAEAEQREYNCRYYARVSTESERIDHYLKWAATYNRDKNKLAEQLEDHLKQFPTGN